MKTTKMSLANMEGKLSRTEMKNIMAGVSAPPVGGGGEGGACESDADCAGGKDMSCNGQTIHSGPGRCYDAGSGKKCHYSVAC